MKKLKKITFLAALCAAFVSRADSVVFLSDAGNDDNDGLSATTPVKTLTKAFSLIPADDPDATLVIAGKFTLTANFTPTAPRTGKITYTQVHDGVDYRGDDHAANAWTLTTGVRFGLTAETVFRDVTFNMASGDINYPFFLLIANYNPVTIDDGVEMVGDFKWSAISSSFSILGGAQDNTNAVNKNSNYNPQVTVKSGDVIIVAYNRGGKATTFPTSTANTATVTVEGGRIHNLYLGSIGNGTWGNTDVVITGGEFTHFGNIKNEGYKPTDSQVMTLDVTALDRRGQYAVLEYNDVRLFNTIHTDLKVPVKVFEPRKTLLADGVTEMPYAIYTTDAVSPDDPKRLVLYLHGMGSRGNDNTTQLSSQGAAPVYPITNEMSNTIIIAPQVPSGERWITLTGGFSFESEQTAWLDAAIALTQQIAREEGVADDCLSAVGASNGAAALWSLMYSKNCPFNRLIPISGYGETSEDTDLMVEGVGQRAVWAFHGTDDATVLIDGMKALAPKLTASDPNFRYSEIEGGDHVNIWRTAAMTPGFAEFLTSASTAGVAPISIGTARKVSVNGNTVTAAADSAALYNAGGVLCGRQSGKDTVKQFTNLSPGVYVMTADGEACKVIVK